MMWDRRRTRREARRGGGLLRLLPPQVHRQVQLGARAARGGHAQRLRARRQRGARQGRGAALARGRHAHGRRGPDEARRPRAATSGRVVTGAAAGVVRSLWRRTRCACAQLVHMVCVVSSLNEFNWCARSNAIRDLCKFQRQHSAQRARGVTTREPLPRSVQYVKPV